MRQEVMEGTTRFWTDSREHISKAMAVFYNPRMQLNRDLTLLLIAAFGSKRIALPMEASGVRAARIMNELVSEGIIAPDEVAINDISPSAIEYCKTNIEAVRKTPLNVTYSCREANRFLLENRCFDYIDIDPFGSPNPFLDAAVKRISGGGVIGVTATDTAALTGTYPAATMRKYWAQPSRSWAMHEWGVRILIRKVQLVGAQYDKALIPILSISNDHYYRIFFRCEKGRGLIKRMIAQHKNVRVDSQAHTIRIGEGDTGPLWAGDLHDPGVVMRMLEIARGKGHFSKAEALLQVVQDEARMHVVGFIDLHQLARVADIDPPARDPLLEALGGNACRTHITPTGIKTSLSIDELALMARETKK